MSVISEEPNKLLMPVKTSVSGTFQVLCDICGKPLKGNWCTMNVCEQCCKKGKCEMRYKCKAYPKILEELLQSREEVIKNPSKRVKLWPQ